MSAGSDALPGPLAASSKGEDYDHPAVTQEVVLDRGKLIVEL